ncbi:MAG: thioredoxin domain-containing protein [Rhodospirillaceae bacterium]
MSQNRLGAETSPYLLQHADNPVHWRPWDEAALAEAKAADRPILLSIGYAACHWCHVMAHESFEDAATAALMNELFVSIKVDREERPDLDAIYQHALALLGQQGGWPLTMFLNPDGQPFWGGTYFPPESRWGRPGFRDVLRGIADVYRTKPDKVAQNATALTDGLHQLFAGSAGDVLSIELADRAALAMLRQFDMTHGGIGSAPKFPNPPALKFVWRAWKRTGNTSLRDAVLLTLDKMSQGGIYDHLGGGYARYSTDAVWLAPHFEKMLYDNAQLLDLLVWAWQDTQKPLYAMRVRETVAWLLREMIADGGGLASTLDADSEGEEGRFYVWSEAEIDTLLGADAPSFNAAYDVTPGGNWEGHNILNRTQRPELLSDDEEAMLARCRATLLAARESRVRPGWDDKVLADWNGLMIAALANAAFVFGEPAWLQAAQRAFAFVRDTMQRDGRLFHTWRAGRLQHAATLDDYADMARAALALHEATGHEATGEREYLHAARGWVDVLDRHYWDDAGGGYYFTAADAPALILRTKSAADNATPSGNGVVAGVLARLYHLTGEDKYRARAEDTVRAFSGDVAQNFFPLATLFNASELLQHAQQVVVVAAPGDPAGDAMVDAVRKHCLPNRILMRLAPGHALPPAHPAHGKDQVDGRATAYVCVGTTCSLPMTDPQALASAL